MIHSSHRDSSDDAETPVHASPAPALPARKVAFRFIAVVLLATGSIGFALLSVLAALGIIG